MRGSKLIDDAAAPAIFGVHRNSRQGPFDAESAQILALVLPHLRRAAQMQRRLMQSARRDAASDAIIEHLPWAAFVLDGQGRVLSANAAAGTIAAADDGLTVKSGRLAVADHRRSRDLSALVAGTVASGRGDGGISGPISGPRRS